MSKALRMLALLVAVGALMLTIVPSFAQAQSSLSSIRLVNASPDAPALDFYFNQKKTYTALKFKDISAYINIADGSYDVKAFASPSDGTGTAVFEIPGFTVNNGSMNTLVTVGLIKNKSVTALPLIDNNTLTSTDSRKAKLRFIHGSPDAPAVNVEAQGIGEVFNNISFKSVGSYVTTTAGPITLTVKPTSDLSKVVFSKTLSLEASKVYSIFVVGELAGTGLETVIAVDKAITGMPATGQGNKAIDRGWASISDNQWLLGGLLALLAAISFYYTRRNSRPKKNQ